MIRRTNTKGSQVSKVSQAARVKEVFSLTLSDYDILKDEVLKNLGYLRRKTDMD